MASNKGNEDFASFIQEWASKAQLDVVESAAGLARDALAVAINSSPDPGRNVGGYSTGHFMNNWHVS